MEDPLVNQSPAAGAEELFELSGGWLCLDFANTLSSRPAEQPLEGLRGYADLLRWSQQTGLIDERRRRFLLAQAAMRPREAEAVLGQALALREAIFRVFAALAGRTRPETADLDLLSQALGAAMAHSRIVPQGDGFDWVSAEQPEALDQVLWPVARSAAELLTTDNRRAVRVCASRTCDWLFMDRTRNRSRQWCDMRVCGNREKARRHYQRTKAAQGRGTGERGSGGAGEEDAGTRGRGA